MSRLKNGHSTAILRSLSPPHQGRGVGRVKAESLSDFEYVEGGQYFKDEVGKKGEAYW